MADSQPLDAEQVSALLDVLSHHQTYDEIEQFKTPDAIHNYGPPFQDDCKSQTPILQSLVNKFALPLPGLKNFSSDFWKSRIETLLANLANANLSESYDKGNLGIRKTLATASSALLEYIARGTLGGYLRKSNDLDKKSYNVSVPEDVVRAWHDWLQQIIYGDMINQLYDKAVETDQLSDHDELTQAAHEYVVVNLASFMHNILIVSPEGPMLLRMIDNVHKLAPYSIMRPTLRIGNVATMLNALMKVVLAKMTIGSFTNWLGLSNGVDEGMNLMQQIMSTVLGWDRRELKKRATRLEKDSVLGTEVRNLLKEYIEMSREEQLEIRRLSREQSMSIVTAILSLSSTSVELTEEQHSNALEYLRLQLAIRDRRQIIKVLCQSNPDHLTQAVRDGVDAYEPMIRHVHQAVDLSSTLSDFEAFVTDTIKLSKSSNQTPASVEDFVRLLHQHQHSSHRFIHQVANNGKELTDWFREYTLQIATHFRLDDTSTGITTQIANAFSKLDKADQTAVGAELNAHAKYLRNLKDSSNARVSQVVRNLASEEQQPGDSTQNRSERGPGSFLARWQDLMDSTLVTPDEAHGPVRTGASASVKAESARDFHGRPQTATAAVDARPPNVELTIRLLGPRFRELLIEKVI